MFSSVLGFDPTEVFLPEVQRELDDDYLYCNEKPMPEFGYWSDDPDFSCNPDE